MQQLPMFENPIDVGTPVIRMKDCLTRTEPSGVRLGCGNRAIEQWASRRREEAAADRQATGPQVVKMWSGLIAARNEATRPSGTFRRR